MGDASGKIHFLDRDTDPFHPTHIIYQYKRNKTLPVEDIKVTSISISPSETRIILFTNKSQMFDYISESDDGDMVRYFVLL